MLIGELAARTGVPQRLLRSYEARGLLTPGRTAGDHRVFEESDVKRVEIIRALLATGLNTATIAVVLPCTEYEGGRLQATCSEMIGHLNHHRAQLMTSISRLKASQRQLDGIIDARRHAAVHTAFPG